MNITSNLIKIINNNKFPTRKILNYDVKNHKTDVCTLGKQIFTFYIKILDAQKAIKMS